MYRVAFAIFLYEEVYPQTRLFACMFSSYRRDFFGENGVQKNKEILWFSDSRKKLTCWSLVRKKPEVAWKWAFCPCRKFKITDTADDQVDRIPGNIPGAGLSEEDIEKCSNFCLKCHRINQNGNKKGLLKTLVYICCSLLSYFQPKVYIVHGLDTCFHTKFAFSGSRTWKQWKSKNIWPWRREDLH